MPWIGYCGTYKYGHALMMQATDYSMTCLKDDSVCV